MPPSCCRPCRYWLGRAVRSEIRLVAGARPPPGAYDADIIILSLNRPAETKEAIASALGQRGGEFHVSVLDQGSSPEMLRELIERFGKTRNFALYAASANHGVAGGRNRLAGFGHGQILVGLDNDARFADNKVVAGAVRRFQRESDLGALAFCILAADGQAPDLGCWGYSPTLLPRLRGRFEVTRFVGAGHAIRRAAWQAVGGYDESFFFAWEEYDFCLSAISRGWRILYDGGLSVIHTSAVEARLRWQDERTRHFIRNRLIIGRKWGQSWLTLSPRILGYGLVAARHARLKAAWDGIRQGMTAPIAEVRTMPRLMRDYIKRHEVRHQAPLFSRLLRACAR